MSCDVRVAALLDVAEFEVRRGERFSVEVPELTLRAGRVAALYGPSGCGKTTVLAALLGQGGSALGIRGAIEVAGLDVLSARRTALRRLLRHDVVLLAQDAHAALDPLETIGAQIRQATEASREAAGEALARLGVEEPATLLDRFPHQISGGQAQRVLLAIAVLRRPRLVLADEPSASLDGGSYAELVAHLRALLQGDSAVLMATHDHRLLRDLDAEVYAFESGKFVPCALESVSWPEPEGRLSPGEAVVLSARELRVAFGPRVVLADVDFHIARGEIVAVVGESGAGKTTLVRALAGYLTPTRGTVERPVRPAAVQLCCQDAFAAMTPRRTLESLLDEAHNPFFDAVAMCREMQLDPAVLRRDAAAMSGGERRRAVLMRALAVHPDVVLLDEPTSSLDRAAGAAVLESLLSLQQSRGLAVVLVTHDLELARSVAHRVVEVVGGEIRPC